DLAQRLPHVGLVLHDEDAAAAARFRGTHAAPVPAAGRMRRNTVPPSSRGRASSTPPCWPTMAWQTERPSPVEFLVEKNGSKMRARSASAMPGPRSAI